MHVGDTMLGNVHAHDRLDFTVIGLAVNLCVPLEALAGRLGKQVVCSVGVTARTSVPMTSLGRHELKNVDNRVEAFIPA